VSVGFNRVGNQHHSEHGWIKLRSLIEEINEIKWTFIVFEFPSFFSFLIFFDYLYFDVVFG
jgi:hypothetical protein